MADETTMQPGQEPASSTGQAPTVPAAGQAPESTLTLHEVQAALAAARREAASYRTKLTAFERAQQEAETAKLSDLDKATKRAAQLEAELEAERQDRRAAINRYEVQLAASKLGIIDPEAAVKLLDWDSLDYADDGSPKNLEAALKALLKARPWLAGATPGATGNPTNPARNGGAGAPLTKDDIARMSPEEINRRWPEIQASLAQLR